MMYKNNIERIHDIDIVDLVSKYGIDIKCGKAHCPFHHDIRTPNLSFHKNKFKCFACGEGGDSIDFVCKYFDLGFIDAERKISADFGLNLDLDKPISVEEKSRYYKEQEKKREIKHWYPMFYTRLCKAYKICLRYEKEFDFDDEDCCTAMKYMSQLEYYMDMPRDELFKIREEALKIVERIK